MTPPHLVDDEIITEMARRQIEMDNMENECKQAKTDIERNNALTSAEERMRRSKSYQECRKKLSLAQDQDFKEMDKYCENKMEAYGMGMRVGAVYADLLSERK